MWNCYEHAVSHYCPEKEKINKTNKYLDLKISFRLLYFGQYIAIFKLSVLANNRTHFTY